MGHVPPASFRGKGKASGEGGSPSTHPAAFAPAQYKPEGGDTEGSVAAPPPSFVSSACFPDSLAGGVAMQMSDGEGGGGGRGSRSRFRQSVRARRSRREELL